MKYLLIGILFVCSGMLVNAQQNENFRNKQLLLRTDSALLDTFVLLKGSVHVKGYVEGKDYSINYFTGYLYRGHIPLNTLIEVQYQCLSYHLKKAYFNKSPHIIQPEFQVGVNPFKLENNKAGFDPLLRNEGINSSGSLMRGLSLGNNQNAIVNANLNLQLAGKLNNEIDILAAISDDNNPIQPEGNTQELQDFDQVYIQFSKGLNKMVVGDYLMSKPSPSYFLQYNKKSRGLMVKTAQQLSSKSTLSIEGQAALSRGRFQRNLIAGIEGNQGPYRLTGPNGELFIILVSGTEVVYLDGEKLVRGEQNDYTIDYNSGEIIFMPRRLITRYSRIIVEFQYSDRNYARTLFGLNTRFEHEKYKVYLNYFTEQDNKNQPFQQSLSDSNKLLLSEVGDNLGLARVSGENKVLGFNGKKILYLKKDTLSYTGVYVHAATAGTDSVFYEVRFSYVGSGKGNYIQGVSSANGRVFQWVEPKNGVKQGDFEPSIQLIAPNRKQLLNGGMMYSLAKGHDVMVEAAYSNNTRNLFSDLDRANDHGIALKLKANNEFKKIGSNNSLNSEVDFEYTSKHFSYIERYRTVEFNRIWNRQLNNQTESDTGNEEQILNWKLQAKIARKITLSYQLGYYNKNASNYTGLSHEGQFKFIDAKNNLSLSQIFIKGKQNLSLLILPYTNQVQNFQFQYARIIGPIQIGVGLNQEQSVFYKNQDSMMGGSFSFTTYHAFLKSKDSSNLSYFLDYQNRKDFLPLNRTLEAHTQANDVKAGLSYLQKNYNRLSMDITYRQLSVIDTAFLGIKPEQTLLSRITYDYAFFKRRITANTYLQLGSGNELRRDFQYVEVPVGQGIYVWKDFNEDGVQQINEFQLASFADKNLANYIKVFLPTTSLIRVSSTQFNQTLNINPLQGKRVEGFKKFLNRFSDQAAFKVERKIQIGSDQNLWNWEVADTGLINLNATWRNTIFFNRNNPTYGLDFTYSEQQSRNLLTNGFESRNRLEYSWGGRLNITSNWAITGLVNIGEKYYQSDFFTSNNFKYQYTEYKPKLSYQFKQNWRLSFNYSNISSANQVELGGEKAGMQEIGSELRIAFAKLGVLNARYSLYEVSFNGNMGSPLAYDMLQGLSAGENQIWGLALQQRLGQNLQINLSYEGRKSGNIPVIHTGKMEARYLF